MILFNQNVTGNIIKIQHFSIHDGPGIRSTVFMKGCPLNCLWCHNPESVSSNIVLSFNSERCIGCGKCFAECVEFVHEMKDGKHLIDRKKCTSCGSCTKVCNGVALELIGREITVKDVLEDVVRDRLYYHTSGGGITLSGGEPLMQFEFTFQLLLLAKEEGINCVVETCGLYNYELYEEILPLVDIFLFDYKETNPKLHKQFTGSDNVSIISNLYKLDEARAKVILRCPVIPGVNDREEHFAGIAKLTRELKNLIGVEILPYHKLGFSKAERVGLIDRKVFEEPDEKIVQCWKDRIIEMGGTIK